MTTFVVLAAGRGTRSRPGIHKALLPVRDKAVLSHLFHQSPPGSKLVVVVGHMADQVRAYCRLAHPGLDVTFVPADFDGPGSGPGKSLLAARSEVVGDLVFTSCDTLWKPQPDLWTRSYSWVGVAPIPEDTKQERWCRVLIGRGAVSSRLLIADKDEPTPSMSGLPTDEFAWTGLARIAERDLGQFWSALERGGTIDGERQISSGLKATPLGAVHVDWTDTGDTAAYEAAVGYDFTKPDEATWITGRRVVKWFNNNYTWRSRMERADELAGFVPPIVDTAQNMFAYDYVPGVSGYEADIDALLDWAETIWEPDTSTHTAFSAAQAFYRDKTWGRVAKLTPDLRMACEPVLKRVDWEALAAGIQPSRFHGDLNLCNVIQTDGGFLGIDWRGDFAGHSWGDARYDQAKLLVSTVFDADKCRRGDFTPWDRGPYVAGRIRARGWYNRDTEIIAALTMLNSAPLHAAPLDRILVERGTDWLRCVL